MKKSLQIITIVLCSVIFISGQNSLKSNAQMNTGNDGSGMPVHLNKTNHIEGNNNSPTNLPPNSISGFPYNADQSYPISLGGNQILMIFNDYRTLYYSKSYDGGSTWQSQYSISNSSYIDDIAAIRTSSGRIITICSSLNGLAESFSDQNGTSWSTVEIIDSEQTYYYYPSLSQTSDGKLWLVYCKFSATTSNDIYYRTSTDNGNSWSTENILTNSPYDQLYGYVISKDASNLIAFYEDNSSGIYKLNYKTSTNNGLSWSTAKLIHSSSFSEVRPKVLKQSDGTIWILYQKYTPLIFGTYSYGQFNQSDIYSTKSTDGGVSWSSASQFTKYTDYDGWLNATMLNDQPFVSFLSYRWRTNEYSESLWYGVIGLSSDLNAPPALNRNLNTLDGSNNLDLQAWVSDDAGISNITFNYTVNGIQFGPIAMFDDGKHNDSLAGDNIYNVKVGPFGIGDIIGYKYNISDVNSNQVSISGSSIKIKGIHNAGNFILSFDDNSSLGDQGAATTTSGYWPRVNGKNYLFMGGLWAGINTGGNIKVMSTDYNSRDWMRDNSLPYTLSPGLSALDGNVSYNDVYGYSSQPIGIDINQQSYQWSDSSRDDFIIFKYNIKNTGQYGDLSNLFISQWLDPDISPRIDLVGYDVSRRMIFVYSSDNNPSGYLGLKLLGSTSTVNTRNIYGYPTSSDPYDASTRYQYMTAGFPTIPSTTADYRAILTAAPFSLKAGETKTITYGIVMGNGLDDLKANADTMEAIFNNLIVSVKKDDNTILPVNYSLSQNYPNPFNPITTINYSIAKEGCTKIIVYDITGSKVAKLVDENKQAGNYSVQFNAAKLPSGIYFYKLESGGYSDIKKLVVIK